MNNRFNQTGFTLIEITIVLLIVAILLGYTIAMFPIQQELKQYRQAEAEMESLIDELVAFAQVNGRLPCPDTDNDGLENGGGGVDCTSPVGSVPGRTMAVDGRYVGNNLIDPWGGDYLYQVANIDDNGGGSNDFTTTNEMRTIGIAALMTALTAAPPASAGLSVCNTNPATHTAFTPTDELDCDAGTEVVEDVVAVIYSFGKERRIASDIESENADNSATDTVFVSTTRSDSAASRYDDVVKWLSPNKLFSKMIEADQLP